jgi:hypothetical protein
MRVAHRSSLLLAILLAIGLALGLAGPLAGEADAQSVTRVHVIEVNGPIDRPLRAYLEERLAEAERAGAIVVMELDTPGAQGPGGVGPAPRVPADHVPVEGRGGPAPGRARSPRRGSSSARASPI